MKAHRVQVIWRGVDLQAKRGRAFGGRCSEDTGAGCTTRVRGGGYRLAERIRSHACVRPYLHGAGANYFGYPSDRHIKVLHQTVPSFKMAIIKGEARSILEKRVIQQSKSPCIATIVLQKKTIVLS